MCVFVTFCCQNTPVEMPPPPPFTRFLTLPLTPPTLPTIPAPSTPLPHHRSPGERLMTMSHSTGGKSSYHGIKWCKDHCGVKQDINGPHLFRQCFLSTTIGSHLTSRY